MFVAEQWRGASAAAVDIDNLLEKFVPRPLDLTLFIARVTPVLADQQDAVNGQLPATECQRLRNRRIDLHARKLTGPVTAQIALGNLVGIERHQVHRGEMVTAVPRVTPQQTIDKMLGMRPTAVLGHDGGDLRSLHAASPGDPCRSIRAAANGEGGSRLRAPSGRDGSGWCRVQSPARWSPAQSLRNEASYPSWGPFPRPYGEVSLGAAGDLSESPRMSPIARAANRLPNSL